MNMALFNKVCIVGVGLIGGSLGMAIKKRRLAKLVIGVVRRKKTIEQAFEKKALDVATLDLKEGVKGADLVILCGPVSVIEGQLKTLSRILDPKAIVIDVGSTKLNIEQAAKKYLKKNPFVGCHPMAGSEKTGIENAQADLFNGSFCFLTSSHPKIVKFWQMLGVKTIVTDARRHDLWVATASQLPHLLSFAFLNSFTSVRFPMNPSLKEFARLAMSDAQLWADIFLSNRATILSSLHVFGLELSKWSKALKRTDRARISSLIKTANRKASHVS